MNGRLGLPDAVQVDALPEVEQVELLPLTFAEFYRASRDRLARALVITLADIHLGTEAADEAMARAYQRWEKVQGLDDPAAWVYRVGLNWARSVLARRRRAPSPPLLRWLDDLGPIAEPTVAAALSELPVAQRAVVVCRFYLCLSEAETAQALNTRPGTVKSRLSRGLLQLERRLGHLRPEEHQ
jgi:RNA polymerase sigma-70 factor (ECF subfamily)